MQVAYKLNCPPHLFKSKSLNVAILQKRSGSYGVSQRFISGSGNFRWKVVTCPNSHNCEKFFLKTIGGIQSDG